MSKLSWPIPRKDTSSFPVLAATAIAGGFLGVFLSRNFFESEKKVTCPIETDYGVGDPQFARSISQLMGPPLLQGNSVTILENGAEIFPAMLDAISRAKRSVTFENFVFTHGEVTDRFAHAFADAARRGLKVHMLQDAAGCDCVMGDEMCLMKEAGVQVEVFRFFHLRFNERTHRKLLIIDGEYGFIGGVGIADTWDGDADSPEKWRDTQYLVRGPVVGQMQAAFLDNWIQTRGCVLHGEDYFPQLNPEGTFTCQAFQSSSAEGADSARLMFIFSIAAARKSIRIANAYFIPDDLTVATLIEARKRGVSVEVITPSEAIDQRVVRYAGRSRWRGMLESGVRFYEYQRALYHCKYMIVDDLWTCVGSCNFDNRSLRLNEEANLNVLDASFAKEHVEVFERDKANSRRITLDDWHRRPMAEKIQGSLGCLLRSQI
jgi:cardiolipin synthase